MGISGNECVPSSGSITDSRYPIHALHKLEQLGPHRVHGDYRLLGQSALVDAARGVPTLTARQNYLRDRYMRFTVEGGARYRPLAAGHGTDRASPGT